MYYSEDIIDNFLKWIIVFIGLSTSHLNETVSLTNINLMTSCSDKKCIFILASCNNISSKMFFVPSLTRQQKQMVVRVPEIDLISIYGSWGCIRELHFITCLPMQLIQWSLSCIVPQREIITVFILWRTKHFECFKICWFNQFQKWIFSSN